MFRGGAPEDVILTESDEAAAEIEPVRRRALDPFAAEREVAVGETLQKIQLIVPELFGLH